MPDPGGEPIEVCDAPASRRRTSVEIPDARQDTIFGCRVSGVWCRVSGVGCRVRLNYTPVIFREARSVVLATPTTITHHVAATEAASIQMHYEGEVVETPLGSFAGVEGIDGVAVLAPNQGLVEFFPGDRQQLATLGPVAALAAASGWRVAVLVPTERMGDAHMSLRGFPLHLQSWWPEGDHIRFGGPEVP